LILYPDTTRKYSKINYMYNINIAIVPYSGKFSDCKIFGNLLSTNISEISEKLKILFLLDDI